MSGVKVKPQLSLSSSNGISVPGGVSAAKRITLVRSLAPVHSSCFCSSRPQSAIAIAFAFRDGPGDGASAALIPFLTKNRQRDRAPVENPVSNWRGQSIRRHQYVDCLNLFAMAIVDEPEIEPRRCEVSAAGRESHGKLACEVHDTAGIDAGNGGRVRKNGRCRILRRERDRRIFDRLGARIENAHGKAHFLAWIHPQPVTNCERQQNQRVFASSGARETDLVTGAVDREADAAACIRGHRLLLRRSSW